MPPILNLKFKGNKSFVAFSNLADTESLTKTWKVCSKVASYLEQGQRLENLSWRLWHLQSLMVDTDNARSKREFKKLSKCMGDKLDKEKGRSIEELEAPDFKHNAAADLIRQRAVEKERNREASHSAKPGTIRRMQFIFSVDQPQPPHNNTAAPPIKKPDLKPSPQFKDISSRRGGRQNARADANPPEREPVPASSDVDMADDEADNHDFVQPHWEPKTASDLASVHFPSYFPNGFDASAFLYSESLSSSGINYSEGVGLPTPTDGFSVLRPTIELPLDDILNNSESAESSASDSGSSPNSINGDFMNSDTPDTQPSPHGHETPMHCAAEVANSSTPKPNDFYDSSESSDDDNDLMSTTPLKRVPPISQPVKEHAPTGKAGSSGGLRGGTRSAAGRPALTVRTQPLTSRVSGPGATATNVNAAVVRNGGGNSNSAPGGVKAECSNCGATHTPLWRRGLNDELNCNACGLYCKLHKRPRPKSMRNTHGEGRTQATPRQETVDVTAQCHNCHTTATPLWRKDDEGKTVCNACGLYYKLHGSSRPISMKSDVIRKRSRHDARRAGPAVEETPSASPGASRRASPIAEPSPTLAPDSTTQISYDYNSESEFRIPQSELNSALGQEQDYTLSNAFANMFAFSLFPGPYHPDFLQQYQHNLNDSLPFASVNTSENEKIETPSRSTKRRRMSTESASEPPSSAVSFGSYTDGVSSASSTTSLSQRPSMEFPYSNYSSFNVLRGSRNTFWHPPMLPQDHSPRFVHPPMLPPEESPMDFLHPPMMPHDEDNLFSAYLHPPMVLSEEQHSSAAMSSMQPHPPMFPNDSFFSSGRSESYESAMHPF